MRTERRRRAWAAVVLGLLFAASPARAQSSAARAQALFDDGVAALDRKEYATAIEKLSESARLEPGVGVRLYLAEAEERAGLLASAWAEFVAAESLARQTPTKENLERAELAKKRAAALAPRLATLAITVAARPEGLRVVRDDAEVAAAEWDSPFPVDRGRHVVRATAPGKRSWSSTVDVLRDADRVRVVVPALEDEPAVAQAPTADSPPPPVADSGGSSRIVPLVLGGVGLAALGVGTAFGIATLSKASDVKAMCPAYPTCDPAQRDAVTSSNTSAQHTATVSTVALVVGVVAVGAAVVLWISGSPGVSAAAAPR
jgi:hypothetical protein